MSGGYYQQPPSHQQMVQELIQNTFMQQLQNMMGQGHCNQQEAAQLQQMMNSGMGRIMQSATEQCVDTNGINTGKLNHFIANFLANSLSYIRQQGGAAAQGPAAAPQQQPGGMSGGAMGLPGAQSNQTPPAQPQQGGWQNPNQPPPAGGNQPPQQHNAGQQNIQDAWNTMKTEAADEPSLEGLRGQGQNKTRQDLTQEAEERYRNSKQQERRKPTMREDGVQLQDITEPIHITNHITLYQKRVMSEGEHEGKGLTLIKAVEGACISDEEAIRNVKSKIDDSYWRDMTAIVVDYNRVIRSTVGLKEFRQSVDQIQKSVQNEQSLFDTLEGIQNIRLRTVHQEVTQCLLDLLNSSLVTGKISTDELGPQKVSLENAAEISYLLNGTGDFEDFGFSRNANYFETVRSLVTKAFRILAGIRVLDPSRSADIPYVAEAVDRLSSHDIQARRQIANMLNLQETKEQLDNYQKELRKAVEEAGEVYYLRKSSAAMTTVPPLETFADSGMHSLLEPDVWNKSYLESNTCAATMIQWLLENARADSTVLPVYIQMLAQWSVPLYVTEAPLVGKTACCPLE